MRNSFWIPKNTKLLVTSRIHFELDAASEVWHALRATGICPDADVYLIKRGREWIRGVIAFAFDNDPYEAIRAIRDYFEKKPWIMEFTERIFPVEYVSDDIDEIARYISGKVNKIFSNNTRWRIRIHKHNTVYKRSKILEKVANVVNIGKVDLEKPDITILINLIKNTITVSFTKPNQIIRKKDVKNKLNKKELTL
ncbi:MAG: THUMP domain-containing protein [Candidatus Njordarchaeia archaeon]